MVMSDAISLQTQLKQTVRTLPLCNYVRLATWELLVFFVTTIGILGVIGYLPLCVSMYVCFARSTNVYIIHRYQSTGVPWAWYNMSQGHCTDDVCSLCSISQEFTIEFLRICQICVSYILVTYFVSTASALLLIYSILFIMLIVHHFEHQD